MSKIIYIKYSLDDVVGFFMTGFTKKEWVLLKYFTDPTKNTVILEVLEDEEIKKSETADE